MPTDCISFKETGYFSRLICDYLDEKEHLKPFYHRFPKLENFKAQIEEKQAEFTAEKREILVSSLQAQYKEIQISTATKSHLNNLLSDSTFTVTTGHQLNIFTGPLYFLYKIVSTINLTKKLKEKYAEYDFVPVYWMATEDHDFEEINYFNFNGKKFQWNKASSGAVGELSTNGLEEVYELFAQEIGLGKAANELKELFKSAYLNHNNLTDATRFLVNELFGEYGLVIVDGNDKALKTIFKPYMEDDIFKQTSSEKVLATSEALNALPQHYKIQVNPREINLFYLDTNIRERIIEKDGHFFVNETDISWSASELKTMLENSPEKFSPNVIMRPLYQEVILPNICYIGGGGELAYWLELKSFFESVSVTFPMLLLRNSVLMIDEKQEEKLQKLHISHQQLFLKRDEFINRKVREISDIDIDFSLQKKYLQEQFENLYTLAEQTDKSFLGAVKAQEVKQLKGLEHLEKRLLKAQKKKLADHVTRITDLQNELFPQQSLQERNLNFSAPFLAHGKQFVAILLKELDPLHQEFAILVL
ncbi:bacillithiol biosynthesis cysteine-adding enzyme BshC [Zhouia sp. PK063]|uniref:bacillithiol biosynthesis cysteine-adding enzyme BshC n=1 Tax=Zhouia sp. PK063 TaxID=3373602 RepID=UPI003795FD8B